MSTDYKKAKDIPLILEKRFDEAVIVVDCIETFRRYLSQIAKAAQMQFNTKKVDEVTIRILRTK